MTTAIRSDVSILNLAARLAIALAIAVLAVGALSINAVGAQSAGCADGPFAGATALDSDGDGVNDGDEVLAGTDQCDPASTPVTVCGAFVASYDAATADTDGDGVVDRVETVSYTHLTLPTKA